MSDMVIRVEGLGKRYRMGQRQQYRMLREVLSESFQAPFRRLSSLASGASSNGDGRVRAANEWFWALQDVSFSVKKGEVVGFIGRNGAGKSTLLKIISRITKPTSGYAEVHGRAGSLLEVGTGFHPELTGRENIYLNGAILGMKKPEIDRKFDEIVAFAEIDMFLDTPVKHYSSGMYVRLAFAVAAHLEPEILLVDEVLSVGDAAFQKKSFDKIQSVVHEGRTVFFVSHSMSAIARLCKRAILLEEGHIVRDGPPHQVVSTYLNAETSSRAERVWVDPQKAPQGEIVRLRAVRVLSEKGQLVEKVDIRDPVRISIEYEVLKPGFALLPNLQFYNEQGIHAFSAHDLDPAWRRRHRPVGRYSSTAWIPGNFLSEGTVFVGVGVGAIDPVIDQFYEGEAVAFQVFDTLAGDSARGDYSGDIGGVVRPLFNWKTELKDDEAG